MTLISCMVVAAVLLVLFCAVSLVDDFLQD